MGQRLELQAILKSIAPNVYFQPGPSPNMKYPAIVYFRDRVDIRHADNSPYKHKRRYQVSVIDRDPDSPLVGKVADLPSCMHNRSFAIDGLNHDVFNLFF